MKLLFFFLIIFIASICNAQSWREIESVEDLCSAYPGQMKTMLSQFNLDYEGMGKVKSAYESGNLVETCKQLLEYYKNGNNAAFLRRELPVKSDKTNALADTILTNVFVIQNVRGQVPWGDDGHRDWYYKGPNNDKEWAWLSNRHSQVSTVFATYFKTGNPKYAEYIDEFLRDFIIKSMPYPAVKSNTSVWRGLEVAARAKGWSRIFYGLLNSEYLSPATRLLILSSLPDHAHYSRNFHGGNNWLTMEISALATVATNFPEYKKSPEWLAYSIETMTESMKGQVYPDGTQTELTSHYHNVAMQNFKLFKDICDRANAELPFFFNKTIEKMYSYIAHAVRPDGHRILNNDGDRGSDTGLILQGAKTYNHADWEYIATNGRSGENPNDGPSYFYPWAGHLISRSGFDKDAQWSFFDIGPWGSGHQHNDMLHISISAYGRDFLVDAGRFAYTGEVAEKFRGYAKGTQGHNSVIFDGKGQMPGIPVAEDPLSENHWKITPDFDYAWNSFSEFANFEGVTHNRSLLYVRGEFWIIVDRINSKDSRSVETFWHWHPTCKVAKLGDGSVETTNERGNLKIIPVGKSSMKLDFIKGQETPEIQGWYSQEYNKFEPNIVSVYSEKVKSETTNVWVLVPFEKVAPELKCKITSKSKNGIELMISEKNKGSWKLSIPYSDSENARFDFTK